MAKKLIKRFLPSKETIKKQKGLGIVNRWLHQSNLWQLNRRSASGAFAVGLFMAFIPLPCQMALAAAGAILFQVNLPLSIALVWLTNPVTMPPIFYATYQLGAWILQPAPLTNGENLSWSWIKNVLLNWQWMSGHWQELTGHLWAFLLGSVLCGAILAFLGYWGIRLFWRCSMSWQWQRRQARRKR
jgi:uncharacterized protein (DUF2062 family)